MYCLLVMVLEASLHSVSVKTVVATRRSDPSESIMLRDRSRLRDLLTKQCANLLDSTASRRPAAAPTAKAVISHEVSTGLTTGFGLSQSPGDIDHRAVSGCANRGRLPAVPTPPGWISAGPQAGPGTHGVAG